MSENDLCNFYANFFGFLLVYLVQSLDQGTSKETVLVVPKPLNFVRLNSSSLVLSRRLDLSFSSFGDLLRALLTDYFLIGLSQSRSTGTRLRFYLPYCTVGVKDSN